jgi:hypothetical protein
MSTTTGNVGNPLTNSVYTEQYIGAEAFLNKRDIYNKIFNTYREDEGLADLLLNLGKKKKTDNTTFHHWEDDFLIAEGLVASGDGAAAGAGDTETITLNASSHQDAGTRSPFMVGDLLMVSGGGVTGQVRVRVMAVNKTVDNAHTLTLRPVSSTGDISGITGGELLNWYGTAFADGTLQPDSSVRRPTRFLNQTQILKTQFETHGSVAANKSEVEINGKPYYYLKGVDDAVTKQMLAVNYTLILGERADNLIDATAPDGSADVTTTEGLERTIEERGINQIYGVWDFAEIETMVANLDDERVADEYCGLMGTLHFLAHESAHHTRNQDTGIRYTMFNTPMKGGMSAGTKDRAVSYGFDCYRTGSRTFHVKKWDALTYQPITGFNNNPYSDMGFWMPMKAFKDAKTEKGLYSVLLRYKANDMENRFMKEWQRDRNVTNKDAFEWNHQSEVGLQLGLVNGFTRTAR